ncbi:MAG: hypothetical protein ABIK09_08865 [Pseudomonadota bacterium]
MLDDDKHDIGDPEPDDEDSGQEPLPKEPEPQAVDATPLEDRQPQHDFNNLEVVTTSPADGRGGQGRGQQRRSSKSRPGGLAADDPFWTFGTPQESWGSSNRKAGGANGGAPRPRVPGDFLECRLCGVKVEKKRAHGRGKVPCPMCNRWMQISRKV